jgi:hypothetical protein
MYINAPIGVLFMYIIPLILSVLSAVFAGQSTLSPNYDVLKLECSHCCCPFHSLAQSVCETLVRQFTFHGIACLPPLDVPIVHAHVVVCGDVQPLYLGRCQDEAWPKSQL